LVADIKKNNAFACGRVMKCAGRIFCDELKERVPPRSIGRIEDLFPKLLEFFNANESNRFRDGFLPLFIDSFSVLEFFKWQGLLYSMDSSESELNGLYSTQ
jgi:hypothetical protein